jgi:3-oxoacyl-[acyl-carrier-protein] synthase-3
MAYLNYISYYLPPNILTNDNLAIDFGDWTAEKIKSKTGISSRHIVNQETVVDMAIFASNQLFNDYNIDRSTIDFVILMTQTPDYLLPTSACIVQDRLGLNKNIGALDINLGCSAYIYALALINSIVTTGLAKNVLLITSETYSKHINKHDKSVRTLFGDGSSASLISNKKPSFGAEIGQSTLGTDGSGWNKLIIPSGGGVLQRTSETALEFQDGEYIRSKDNIYMDGPGIMSFTLDVVPKSITDVLEKNNLSMNDIDLFVFHQASIFILNYFKKSLKIPDEKFVVEIEDIGNTVSSTIPIAIKRSIEKNRIKSGMKIILVGFGVGLSWGATLLKY